MAITRETRPYEVLVRFNPDGFQGAHVIDFDLFVENGKIVGTPTAGLARGITQAEVGKIIGGQSAALIEAADKARAETEEIKEKAAQAVKAASAAAADAAAREAELTRQIGAFKARISELETKESDNEG